MSGQTAGNGRERVLFVASVERHLAHFHTPYIRYLQERGYEVHTAALGENEIEGIDRHESVRFSRSPLGLSNISAYRRMKRIIGGGRYRMIHCHTPVAGILTRLAARRSRREGTRVVYTAHGFHFFEGNRGWKNLLFRNIEKFASRYTDCIITINREDYEALRKYGFRSGSAFLTHGVGVDPQRYRPVDPAEKARRRAEMGFGEDEYLVIYPAEYSRRKNHAVLLRAAALVKKQQGALTLLLPGAGPEEDNIRRLAEELGIREDIRLQGMRRDVDRLLSICDLSVAPALQEGLPTHVIEAMATGLPCVASRVRGQVDLIEDGVNGFLFDAGDPAQMARCIMRLRDDPELALGMRESALMKARSYFRENTVRETGEIYDKLLSGEI